MEDKIALFDMDGTIADYDAQILRDLSGKFDFDMPENLHRAKFSREILDEIKRIKSQNGWWEDLPVIESGMELMKYCVEIGFGIHILTQGPKMKHAWAEKFAWCEKHVPPVDSNYTISITRGGKSLHYGRVLVDDYPPYMIDWLANRPRGLGLMPDLPINSNFKHSQVAKYNPESGKWKNEELVEKLNNAFNRNSREDSA